MNTKLKKNDSREDEGTASGPLAAAVVQAEQVLQRHDKLAAALSATGREIPVALAEERKLRAELGNVEVAGGAADGLGKRLTDVINAREAAARRRSAASEGLLQLSDELAAARQTVTQARQQLASEVAQEFGRRWQQACERLAELQSERAELSRALGSEISCPAPYCVAANVTGGHTVRFAWPLREPVPVSLPPQLQALVALSDRIDAAGVTLASLRQSADLNSKHVALSRIRAGDPVMAWNLFTVRRPFTHLNTTYALGTIVDVALLGGSGVAHRRWLAKEVEPLSDATVRSTAA